MSRLHAGGVIVPTAMATAGERTCDGSKFMEALIIGYELGLRAGMASTAGETYYGSAYGATFGAAAAAGRLLGLSSDQIINAMGISEMHAPNCMVMGWVNSRKIPMIKEGMGWSAASSIMAAYMARQRITGTLTIYDGREQLSRIGSLGREFEIEKRYYKPYPGCRWIHGPLQTLMSLVEEHRLTAGEVEWVEVTTFEKAARLDNPTPATIEEAEYSFPFVLGVSLVDGQFGPKQMTEERLSAHAIIEQAGKIRLKAKPEFDAAYPARLLATVTVKMRDGREYSADSNGARGDWEYPISDGQLKEKFALMCSSRINPDQVESISKRIWNLESETNVGAFIKLINKFVCDPVSEKDN
jgi:2-methylcitrate dehydratase PrpD